MWLLIGQTFVLMMAASYHDQKLTYAASWIARIRCEVSSNGVRLNHSWQALEWLGRRVSWLHYGESSCICRAWISFDSVEHSSWQTWMASSKLGLVFIQSSRGVLMQLWIVARAILDILFQDFISIRGLHIHAWLQLPILVIAVQSMSSGDSSRGVSVMSSFNFSLRAAVESMDKVRICFMHPYVSDV
ncbi:hypothetical protein Dimus_035723 [Dionaea muscipula]